MCSDEQGLAIGIDHLLKVILVNGYKTLFHKS